MCSYVFVTLIIIERIYGVAVYATISIGQGQSIIIQQNAGTNFIPAHPIEILFNYTNVNTFRSCAYYCHQNILCQTFVNDLNQPSSCRLYEGSIDTGMINQSAPSTSTVGNILHYPSLYADYGASCNPDSSLFDRYMICTNGSWGCLDHTYWNGSLCLNQVYESSHCFSDDYCRQDIGLECDSITNQCRCSNTTGWDGLICGPCVGNGQQCGGLGWLGLTLCCSGLGCMSINGSYSECRSTQNTSTTSTSTSTTTSFSNVINETGNTMRFADCCKPSCSWPGKAVVTSPVLSCAKDGVTPIGNNTQSICTTGDAYMCTNQQPWNVSSTLSYGFSSASLTGQNESIWCCACYSLIFTSPPLVGKEMIVQVINTNGNSGNNFGLQIPGAGYGGSFDGCSIQFDNSTIWGVQYGGVTTRTDCAALPVVLQAGCYWRFDWFLDAPNPNITFTEVLCPSVLTAITSCMRL